MIQIIRISFVGEFRRKLLVLVSLFFLSDTAGGEAGREGDGGLRARLALRGDGDPRAGGEAVPALGPHAAVPHPPIPGLLGLWLTLLSINIQAMRRMFV